MNTTSMFQSVPLTLLQTGILHPNHQSSSHQNKHTISTANTSQTQQQQSYNQDMNRNLQSPPVLVNNRMCHGQIVAASQFQSLVEHQNGIIMRQSGGCHATPNAMRSIPKHPQSMPTMAAGQFIIAATGPNGQPMLLQAIPMHTGTLQCQSNHHQLTQSSKSRSGSTVSNNSQQQIVVDGKDNGGSCTTTSVSRHQNQRAQQYHQSLPQTYSAIPIYHQQISNSRSIVEQQHQQSHFHHNSPAHQQIYHRKSHIPDHMIRNGVYIQQAMASHHNFGGSQSSLSHRGTVSELNDSVSRKSFDSSHPNLSSTSSVINEPRFYCESVPGDDEDSEETDSDDGCDIILDDLPDLFPDITKRLATRQAAEKGSCTTSNCSSQSSMHDQANKQSTPINKKKLMSSSSSNGGTKPAPSLKMSKSLTEREAGRQVRIKELLKNGDPEAARLFSLPDSEKPWNKPGAIPTDYFNYGLSESDYLELLFLTGAKI